MTDSPDLKKIEEDCPTAELNPSSKRKALGPTKSASQEVLDEVSGHEKKGDENNSLSLPQKNLERNKSQIGIVKDKLNMKEDSKTSTSRMEVPEKSTPPLTTNVFDSDTSKRDDSSSIQRGSP